MSVDRVKASEPGAGPPTILWGISMRAESPVADPPGELLPLREGKQQRQIELTQQQAYKIVGLPKIVGVSVESELVPQ